MPSIPSPSQTFLDFTELTEKLHSTAHALLVFGSPVGTKPENETPPAGKKAPLEIRSFQIPEFMVVQERQMVELLKAENWQDMFDKVHDQLYTMAL